MGQELIYFLFGTHNILIDRKHIYPVEEQERAKITKKNLERAKKVMEELENLANQDEKITKEEKDLLNSIKKGIDEYQEILSKSLEDNKVTEEELEEIHILEKRILQDASAQVFSDGTVSEDEKAIMKEIIKIIEDLALMRLEE